MKINALIFTSLLLCQNVFGQDANFQKEFNSINENLMLGLGSYAVANFALSGVGYVTGKTNIQSDFMK